MIITVSYAAAFVCDPSTCAHTHMHRDKGWRIQLLIGEDLRLTSTILLLIVVVCFLHISQRKGKKGLFWRSSFFGLCISVCEKHLDLLVLCALFQHISNNPSWYLLHGPSDKHLIRWNIDFSCFFPFSHTHARTHVHTFFHIIKI